jgi:hypothetical protein
MELLVTALEAAQKELSELRHTQHAGDCTIYSAMMNGCPEDGICTCGYGWMRVRMADYSQMYSDERKDAMQEKGAQ